MIHHYWKGHQTFPLCLTYEQRIVSWYYVFYTSHFVNVFPEKIDNRKTSPVSRVHTNTAKQYTPESNGGPWKHPFLYQDSLSKPAQWHLQWKMDHSLYYCFVDHKLW